MVNFSTEFWTGFQLKNTTQEALFTRDLAITQCSTLQGASLLPEFGSADQIISVNDVHMTIPGNQIKQSSITAATNSYVLDSIITSKEIIQFFFNNRRKDIPQENKLDSIIVTSRFDGSLIKKIILYGSYFNSPSTYDVENQSMAEPSGNGLLNNSILRIRLDSLTMNGVEKYKFAYNSVSLPARGSFDRDAWGYYNRNYYNAPNLTGISSYAYWFDQYTPFIVCGDNICPSPASVAAGTLSQIVYPTGGSTSFVYEPNTIHDMGKNIRPYLNPMVTNYASAYNQVGGTTYSSVINYQLGSAPLTCSLLNLSTTSSSFQWSVYLVDSATLGSNFKTPISDGGLYPGIPPGKYVIVLQISGGIPSTFTAAICNWQSPMYNYNALNDTTRTDAVVGGIRIKEIDDYDPLSNITKVKKYSYNIIGDTASSGQLVNFPQMATCIKAETLGGYTLPTGCSVGACTFQTIHISNSSFVPIQLNTTGNVGYSFVTEDEVAGNEAHRNVYHFTNVSDYPDIKINPQFDYPITKYTAQPFNRGLLLDQTTYAQRNGLFQPAKRLVNNYSAINTLWDTTFSTRNIVLDESALIWANIVCPFVIETSSTAWNGQPHFSAWRTYETVSGYHTLDSAVSFTYGQEDTTNVIRNITYFKYIKPRDFFPAYTLLLPRSNSTINSKGDTITTNFQYAFDLAGATGTSSSFNAGINNLINRGLFCDLVESSTYRSSEGQKSLLRSDFYSYDPAIPKEAQHYNIPNGGESTVFQPATVVAQNIQIDPNYNLLNSNDQYNSYGKLLQQHKANDANEVFLWSYNNAYPVARITGSTYTAVMQNIAQARIDGAVLNDANMRTVLNSIRTSLPSAMVQTFTYKPMIGMSSKTDVNGYTTYYEYDAAGRLKVIRDQDNNIIKTFDYRYKQ